MGEMYSITGFYEQTSIGVLPFGGFFITSPERDPRGLTLPLEGMLIDGWGESTIQGELKHDELEFVKKYKFLEDYINYSFKLEKGIYKGNYSGNSCGNGETVCIIKPQWKDVSLQPRRPFNPEQWANNIVEQMIDSGLLIETKDSKTGERYIRPNGGKGGLK